MLKNSDHGLHIWANLFCGFWAWRWWALPLSQPLLSFWVILIHPHLFTCDNHQNEFWVFFKHLVKVLACDNSSSAPHYAHRTQICWQQNAHSDWLSKCSEVT
jgi:hypothetical protein